MLLFTSAAWALGLAVSPPYQEVEVAPGSVVGRTLAVRNNSPRAVEVKVYLKDWWYDDGNNVFPPMGTIEHSAAVWANVGPEVFRLAADERREVQLELQVPADARGGGYAAVFFEMKGTGGTPGMRMGSLVMVDVGGVPAPAIDVAEVEIDTADGATVLHWPSKHEGETHTFVTVKGIIRREGEGVVTRVTSDRKLLLPGQARVLSATLDRKLEPGIYTIDGVLTGDNTPPVKLATTRFVVN